MAVITGTSGNDTLADTPGDDTINGLGGNDTINGGSGGSDVVNGGDGRDALQFMTATSAVVVDFVAGTAGTTSFTNIEKVVTGDFNDRLSGDGAAQNLTARAGMDTLWGAGGFDTLWGGAGADTFVFREMGSANADNIGDWTSGSDTLLLDGAVMTALGASGDFTAGDARFWSSSTGAAHDADDRIIYETDTRQIWYDADGNGAGARQLIATLQSGATLVATDIMVEGGSGGGNTINGTSGRDSIAGTEGADTINGFAGVDFIDGRGGNDSINGGADFDSLWGGNGSDTVDGGDGPDSINAGDDGMADLVIGGTGNDTMTSPFASGADTMLGGDGDDLFVEIGFAGDSLDGGAGIDMVIAAANRNVLPNGVVIDLAAGVMTSEIGNATLANIEDAAGTAQQNDRLVGSSVANHLSGGGGNDTLEGGGGDDTLEGSLGNDSLAGGAGVDDFFFDWTIAFGAGNADTVTDFASGVDQMHFDAASLEGLGTTGQFSSSDTRFFAAAGATSGHDADDRIIFNTATREIYFDADGSGSGGSHLVATLQAGATLAATDVWVDNGTDPAAAINGTPGDDTLIGGSGNDTINGFGGNDSLAGGSGADELNGGDGNDTLNGESHPWGESDPDVDTLNGGLGNDLFIVDNGADVVTDAGGVDTVRAVNTGWTLGAGFENLFLANGEAEFRMTGIGNELANVLEGDFEVRLEGRGGNDTLLGGGWDDELFGDDGNDSIAGGDLSDVLAGGTGDDTLIGGISSDSLTGGTGADTFVFDEPPTGGEPDAITDFASGVDKVRFDGEAFTTIGASGNFAAGDARFAANSSGTAQDASDRIIYNTSTGELWYDLDGNGAEAARLEAVLQGAPALAASDIEVVNGSGGLLITGTEGSDTLTGTDGNDTINGLGGQDFMFGLGGDDLLAGGAGFDYFEMELGSNGSYGADSIDGGADFDTLDFDPYAQSAIVVDLTAGTVSGGGVGGTGSANLASIEGVLGSAFADRITGSAGDDGFDGKAGNDTLVGLAGDDSFEAGDGDDSIDGGEGADHVFGGDGSDAIDGGAGQDTLYGGASTDEVSDVTADTFRFTVAPGTANFDHVGGFTSGTDKLVLDGAVHANSGPSGNFAAGDARFWSSTTGLAHDADDRVIYNTSSGELWYDADGTGSGAAQLIAFVLRFGRPTGVGAEDIEIINGSAPGNVINGTAGNDTLADTSGNDTINGFAGNDTINGGHGGTDVVNGGDGRDSLAFMTATSAVVANFVTGMVTGGGPGTTSFTDIEKVVTGDFNDTLTGNASAQNLTARAGSDTLAGAGGVDTLWGGAGPDTFIFRENGTANADVIGDWTSGSDEVALDNAPMGALGADGAFVGSDARFWASSTGAAHDANDRVLFNTSTGSLYYDADGTGSGAAQLIATVQAGATVVATDISVI
jgi:Ca2+-binding RTX toxin-like protein